MAIILADCPHCSASKVSFSIIGFAVFPEQTKQGAGLDAHHREVYRWPISVGAVCSNCHKPICALLGAEEGAPSHNVFLQSAAKLTTSPISVETLGYTDEYLWPKPDGPLIPGHVTPEVERAMLQAERNFPIVGNEEASALMYRRALELAFSNLYPAMKGTLAGRIKTLVKDKALPTAMGEWADEIRALGNDAAHDPEEVDRLELKRIRGFADATLRYLYTLPAEVAARRKLPE